MKVENLSKNDVCSPHLVDTEATVVGICSLRDILNRSFVSIQVFPFLRFVNVAPGNPYPALRLRNVINDFNILNIQNSHS